MSVVRDRGTDQDIDEDEEEDEEDEEQEGIAQDENTAVEDIKQDEQGNEGGQVVEAVPAKTGRQQALEAEWGLYRSPKLSQRSEEEDDEDTDNERRGVSHRSAEEDFMVSAVLLDIQCQIDHDSPTKRITIAMRAEVRERILTSSA